LPQGSPSKSYPQKL